jgi:hypothetical protein
MTEAGSARANEMYFPSHTEDLVGFNAILRNEPNVTGWRGRSHMEEKKNSKRWPNPPTPTIKRSWPS